VDLIRGPGGPRACAPPFLHLPFPGAPPAPSGRLSERIDAIEGYNGRNTRDEDNLAAVAYARERGFPVTAGSDAHTPMELARTWMDMERFETRRNSWLPWDRPASITRGHTPASTR